MKNFIHAIIVLVFVALVFAPSLEADTYSIAGDTGDVAFTGFTDYNHASIGLQVTDEVNGLSAGDDPISLLYYNYFYFSVAPGSQGVTGTGVNDRYNLPYQDEEEWLYVTYEKPPSAWNNQTSHRTPGDDLDGYDFTTLATGDRIYFTVASEGSIAQNIIWTAIIGTPASLTQYADATDLGLQADDDLDAISVYDKDGDGVYDTGDLILFSLTSDYPPSSGAEIYGVVAYGASPTSLGLLNVDELNALDVIHGDDQRGGNGIPEPSTFLMMGTAFLGLMAARRRWRR